MRPALILALTAVLVVAPASDAKAEGPFDCGPTTGRPCVDPTCVYNPLKPIPAPASMLVVSTGEAMCVGRFHLRARITVIQQEKLRRVAKRRLMGCDRCAPDCDRCAKDMWLRTAIVEGPWRASRDIKVSAMANCKSGGTGMFRTVVYIWSNSTKKDVPTATGRDISDPVKIKGCDIYGTRFV